MEREKSISEELVELDTQLARLILERTRLLGKAASARKNKRIALADPKQEKRLWAVWKKQLYDCLQTPGPVRELFFQLNALSYVQCEENFTESFTLLPYLRALQADLPGPRDNFYFCCQLFLAALSDTNVRLLHAPQAHNVVDFLTALNGWKAAISRQGGSLEVSGVAKITPVEDLVFVGSYPFTFYILLALALLEPCGLRFVGSAYLRQLNIQNLSVFLPRLGARLTPVEPAGFSLPARLECSGIVPDEIFLTDDLPVDFVAALLLVAPLFSHKTDFVFSPQLRRHSKIQTVCFLLEKFSIVLQNQDTDEQCRLGIVPCRPHVATAELDTPLDVILSAFLLAMPLGCGGVFCVRGEWQTGEQAQEILKLLERLGIVISRTSSTLVSSRQAKSSDKIEFDLSGKMQFFPLALAASILTGKDVCFVCDENLCFSIGLELLNFLGFAYREKNGVLEFEAQKLQLPQVAWTSPQAEWSLAYALISLACPGLQLKNPGQLLNFWPEFWNIFNSLPKPILEKRQHKISEADSGKKAKRIRLD